MGRARQRSVSFHGDRSQADAFRAGLLVTTSRLPAMVVTVADVLEAWLAAEQPWKPSTRGGYQSNARHLRQDEPLAGRQVDALDPADVRRAFARLQADGATTSVISGRFRILRSALSWAYSERLIDQHPLRGMRGPGRAEPRRPQPDAAVWGLVTPTRPRPSASTPTPSR